MCYYENFTLKESTVPKLNEAAHSPLALEKAFPQHLFPLRALGTIIMLKPLWIAMRRKEVKLATMFYNLTPHSNGINKWPEKFLSGNIYNMFSKRQTDQIWDFLLGSIILLYFGKGKTQAASYKPPMCFSWADLSQRNRSLHSLLRLVVPQTCLTKMLRQMSSGWKTEASRVRSRLDKLHAISAVVIF